MEMRALNTYMTFAKLTPSRFLLCFFLPDGRTADTMDGTQQNLGDAMLGACAMYVYLQQQQQLLSQQTFESDSSDSGNESGNDGRASYAQDATCAAEKLVMPAGMRRPAMTMGDIENSLKYYRDALIGEGMLNVHELITEQPIAPSSTPSTPLPELDGDLLSSFMTMPTFPTIEDQDSSSEMNRHGGPIRTTSVPGPPVFVKQEFKEFDGIYSSSSPVRDIYAEHGEETEGCNRWAVWVLEVGAKARNAAIATYQLDDEQASDLKKSSRRYKQKLAQRRYMKSLRQPEAPSAPLSERIAENNSIAQLENLLSYA